MSSEAPLSAEQPNGGLLDLEKELICTEILYQPLTLLDCLHTFCGSCLKEWFSWQATSARSSSHPKPNPYTCPSCRASVRGTRPDARVTTLLDMWLKANPGKGRNDSEKAELAEKYKPGDNVVPPLRQEGEREHRRRRRRHGESGEVERDSSEEDRRQMEEAVARSLRETRLSPEDASRGDRARNRSRSRSAESREERHSRRRREDLERRRRRAHGSGTSTPDAQTAAAIPSARQVNQADARQRERHVEHQASLRSLMSASDGGTGGMEEEILRQIVDEGLLEGINLDDLSGVQEDELSERIADAYRRRHLSQLNNIVLPRRMRLDETGDQGTLQKLDERQQTQGMNQVLLSCGDNARPEKIVPAFSSQDQQSRRSIYLQLRSIHQALLPLLLLQSHAPVMVVQARIRFLFDHCAILRWEASATRAANATMERPHTLVARKWHAPPSDAIQSPPLQNIPSQMAATKPILTTSNPSTRLQSGLFCDRCYTNASTCFWSCSTCNDGEWGFCNTCVDTHHICTHPLLPVAARSSQLNPSSSPHPPPPHLAQDYIVLRVTTHCDVCHQEITPRMPRYHCPFHPSAEDYNICTPCYNRLVKARKIKAEDGPNGWRRCAGGGSTSGKGHRMVVVGFEDEARRVVMHDLVGGWRLREDDSSANATSSNNNNPSVTNQTTDASNASFIQETSSTLGQGGTFTWREPSRPNTPITKPSSVALTPSPHSSPNPSNTSTFSAPAFQQHQPHQPPTFPPSGGIGLTCQAIYSYFPDIEADPSAKDELAFPRGAEITEAEDVNGDWWWGFYCGEGGSWPGNYGRVVG
ncbi:MAG: hypothetical protein Q9160_003695 [Pyrenula sp. 1 TL-2023]